MEDIVYTGLGLTGLILLYGILKVIIFILKGKGDLK